GLIWLPIPYEMGTDEVKKLYSLACKVIINSFVTVSGSQGAGRLAPRVLSWFALAPLKSSLFIIHTPIPKCKNFFGKIQKIFSA
ncbi:MAG: hypothetical protein PUD81_08720, partial [Eggerthellales bacterium]|nr:hypothetical protein [Eggerthellales bacterium]